MANGKRALLLAAVLVALVVVLLVRERTRPGPDPYDDVRTLIVEEKYERAIERMKEIDPQSANWKTHWLRARVYRRLNRFPEARQELYEANARGGDVETLEREQVLCLVTVGEVDRVEKQVLAMINDPRGELTEILPSYAHGLVRTNRIIDAQQLAKTWLESEPDNADAYFLISILWESADLERSVKDLRKGLELRPDRWRMRVRLGKTFDNDRDLENAKREFEAAAALNPNHWEPWARLADIELKLGNLDAAAQAIAKAEAIDPKVPFVCQAGARLAIERREWEVADRKLKIALEADPTEAELWMLEVRRAVGVGDEERAMFAKEKIVETERWREKLEHGREDLTEIRKTRSDPREHARALAKIGATARELDKSGSWHQWYFAAVSVDPNFVDGHLALAEYYDSIGQLERAAEERAKAEKIRSSP
jgi:tetratricopeptide (TPR) repeat protein